MKFFSKFFFSEKIRNFKFENFSDGKAIHFSPFAFQSLGRLNFAFDCFILSMSFILYLTYFFFFLVFGSAVKTRVSLPFYKFFFWPAYKLHTNFLHFWLDLRFLVFRSYDVIFLLNFVNSFYLGYFPLTFYFSVLIFRVLFWIDFLILLGLVLLTY